MGEQPSSGCTPGGEGDRSDRAAVDRQLAAHLARATYASRYAIPAGVLGAAVLLRDEIPDRHLLAWMLLGAANFVRHVIETRQAVARSRRDDWQGPRLLLYTHHFAFGFGWGSLVVVAAWWGTERALWTSAVVVVAVLSVYVVAMAGSRRLFTAGLLGILGPATVGMLLAEPPSYRLAIVTVVYGSVAFVTHGQVHRSLVESLVTENENGRLADELRAHFEDHDPMTNLLNRDAFATRLEWLGTRAEAEQRDLVVAVTNVRRLASINELHGHGTGNAVLVHLAARLSAGLGDGMIAARVGGDEFAVAGLRGSGPRSPLQLLDSITAEPVVIDEHRLEISSVTAEASTAPGQSPGVEVLAEAIAGVRAARNRARSLSDPASVGSLGVRRELADRLLGGLEQAGLQAWFQPIVDAGTRMITGWEALVRWEHPSRGVLGPDQFMPMIAAVGRQPQLLDLVARESTRLLHRLDRHGTAHHTIHLNITAADLQRTGVVRQLLGACFAYGVAPHRLVAELTEQDLVELDERVDANLADLLQSGIQLAVDDFGTGYSSLAHLIDLPTAHLKIDRRFVTHLVEDRSLRALVSGLLGMAHGLGIQAVAEGVETEAQARLLTSMGCSQLQGHLIAPAMHPAEAVAFALDHQRRVFRTTEATPLVPVSSLPRGGH